MEKSWISAFCILMVVALVLSGNAVGKEKGTAAEPSNDQANLVALVGSMPLYYKHDIYNLTSDNTMSSVDRKNINTSGYSRSGDSLSVNYVYALPDEGSSTTMKVEEPAPKPEKAASDPWIIRFAPYLWATDFDGTMGVRGVTTDVKASFSDIFDKVDMCLQGHFEMEKEKLFFFLDGTYMVLEDEGVGPQGHIGAEAEMTMYLVEAGGGYSIWENSYGKVREDGLTHQIRLDLLAGARYTRVEMDIDLTIGSAISGSFDGSETWVDPFVGARAIWSPFNRFDSFLRADIGGFGAASDFAWNVSAGVSVHVMKNCSIMAGYRIYDVDYSHSGFKMDAQMKGPWLALMLTF